MGSERAELVRRLEELDRVFAEAQQALREAGSTYREFARRIAQGSSVTEAFHELEVPEARRGLLDLLERLERARHLSRTATFAVGLAEGMSISEIGRLFGFSRQLAARYAKEARSSGVGTAETD